MDLLASLPPALRRALVALLVLLALALLLPPLLTPFVAARVRALARERGLEASWTRLAFGWPANLDLRDLALRRAAEPTPLVTAEHVHASLGFRFPALRPRVFRFELERARVVLPAAAADDDTTGGRDNPAEPPAGAPAAPRVRAAAQQLADALLLPARRLPELSVLDLDIQRGDSLFARLDALTLRHGPGGAQLAAAGVLAGEQRVPFDAVFQWGADDRLVGRASFHVPGEERGPTSLDVLVDGRVTQDRRHGVLQVGQGTRVRVGRAEMRVTGEVRRAGPALRLALEVRGLTGPDVARSLPPAVLGPLADLSVRGSWDWRASLALDVAHPDSTRFTADVIPHGLALGEVGARLPLERLAGPFLAEIHVPRGIVYRDLSPANPHYRPLERISPLLRFALLTNEDGGFYRHRGFNPEAIQSAMAENLRSGTFKRGAGTITMQLARNLFLGHQRTLSRKAQEVVLAWVLENLTGLSKDRLLEIYLNIIEWGPGVHGADEAARFYFDRDAADLTLDEALFLTVVVPSPTRWRSRLDATGALRPWARSQMAFIARKMASHGWLPPEQVPAAQDLHVELRGPAGQAFAPRDTAWSATPGRESVHL